MYNKYRNAYGEVAQLARASGSYPAGRRFESHLRYQDKFSSNFLKVLIQLNYKTTKILTNTKILNRFKKKRSFFDKNIEKKEVFVVLCYI